MTSKPDTTVAAVVFLIHVTTPHRHIPKLFIKDVPVGTDAASIKDTLEANGYVFGEFGVPWANHYIQIGLKNAAPSVIGAWRSGAVETVSWNDLSKVWDELP